MPTIRASVAAGLEMAAALYDSGQETAFRYQEMQGIGAFVWLEPGMGYAIAGNLPP